MPTSIEWTDETWNPTTGCDRVSPGCDNCYARSIALRRWATQYPANTDGSPRRFEDVRLHPERLERPLRWRRPRRVFVDSMSDLIHEAVPEAFIADVFRVMARAERHVFQVLTKRPRRMREVVGRLYDTGPLAGRAPLANVWLGTSVELDRYAWRANVYLAQTPAAVRFVSAEPLLGPLPGLDVAALDWLIVGGESGPGYRALDLDWVRALRDRCQAVGTPLFFKQVGGRTPKAGGRQLDGHTWAEFPADPHGGAHA
jgi:protein gp37